MPIQLPFVTQSYRLGPEILEDVCIYLIYRSQWFMVMPLPDNQYQLTVKPDAMPFVTDAINTYREE